MGDPNVTDWLTAIGTVGTLAVTVALFWVDRFQRRKREQRAQAVLISGWAGSIQADDGVRALHVLNMSNEPAYNINVFLENENDTTEGNDIRFQPITANAKNKKFLSVLPPKQHVTWNVPRKDAAYPGPNTAPRVGLLFNDRNGTRWFRDWDGKVTRATKEEYDPGLHRVAHADIEPPARKAVE